MQTLPAKGKHAILTLNDTLVNIGEDRLANKKRGLNPFPQRHHDQLHLPGGKLSTHRKGASSLAMSGGRAVVSQVEIETLRPLFNAMRTVDFCEGEKQSRDENLLDVLEIIAVAAGIKPAHLNGHGFRSERLLSDLESVASAFGLTTKRTTSCLPYRHRVSNVPSEVRAWAEQQARVRQQTEPDVLWIFKDISVPNEIDSVVHGDKGCEDVLGYPKCCVKYQSELAVRIGELYFESLAKMLGTRDPAAIIDLMQKDVAVDLIAEPPKMTAEGSARQFPYVQFHACTTCLQRKGSPANTVNARMRELAFVLDPKFGRAVWRAQYADQRFPAPGLNSDCPCGSGLKVKRCCGVAE